MILFVYALTGVSSARVAGRGIGGERLRAVTAGRVTALTGELPRAPKPTMKNLRRYAAVITALAEGTPAILPARFGTCMADLDELTQALRSRQPALRRRLSAVRGRAQMTIRLVLESDSGVSLGSDPRESRSEGQTPRTQSGRVRLEADPAGGRKYLQQRAAAAVQERHLPGFAPIRSAATRWVKDERVEKRAGVATVNHLIPRGSATAYRAAVERAAARAGVRLVVTGPHPPYAFAENW